MSKSLPTATITPVEEHGKLKWFLTISGIGQTFTVERSFPISTYAEQEARRLAKLSNVAIHIVTKNLKDK